MRLKYTPTVALHMMQIIEENWDDKVHSLPS